MNKQESRYSYAASLMDEALLLLLEQKDYDKITVKELCQKAGVNRTTFYLHYGGMNDLLEETVEMVNDRFKESLSAIPEGNTSREVLTSEKYLRPYLSFVKENMRAYRVMHQRDLIDALVSVLVLQNTLILVNSDGDSQKNAPLNGCHQRGHLARTIDVFCYSDYKSYQGDQKQWAQGEYHETICC